MKKLSNNKRRFGKKDLLSWTLITLGHYFALSILTLVFVIAKFYTIGGDFFPLNKEVSVWVIVNMLLAPAVNTSLHITYDEIGSPWTRLLMWIHSLIQLIIIPVMVFMFM